MDSDYLILITGTMGMLILIISFILFGVAFKKKIFQKENELIKIERSLKTEEIKAAYALVEGQNKERKRISLDLHDGLGATLSSTNIYLHLLKNTELTEEQKDMLSKIQDINDLAIDQIRKVSHNLNDYLIEEGNFIDAVQRISRIINDAEKMSMSTSISLTREVPARLMVDGYQIIQELLNNAVKHSDASQINLTLQTAQNKFLIAYNDNGKGFDTDAEVEGIGLQNIQSRVNRHEGEVIVNSQGGVGTQYNFSFALS